MPISCSTANRLRLRSSVRVRFRPGADLIFNALDAQGILRMKLLVVTAMALLSVSAYAKDPEAFCDTGRPSPIEVALSKKLASAASTADMRSAQGEAYAKWDKELNRVYGDLLGSLHTDSDKDQLKRAQRAWLAFQKEEVAWLWSGALYGQTDTGTLAPVIVSDIGRAAVSKRVCELMRYRKMVYQSVD